MIALLEQRLEELTQAEKVAWAELNHVLGRKAEAEDMLVRLKTTMAGPEGNHAAGSCPDLPERQALELIEGGYAESVGPSPKPAAPAAEVKTAVSPAAPEKAVSRKRRQ